MKQYKHKQTGITAILKPESDNYEIDYFQRITYLPKSLIENTNDWEEVKPEPKYEVGDWVKYRNGKEKEEIGYTTQLTYTLCKELQSEGKLISIGYNLGKGIWEDVNNSKNYFKSLTWQII